MNDNLEANPSPKTQLTPHTPSGSAVVSHISAVEFTAFSGPLPHPEVLKRFDEVYPGAAKQIFDDFTQESAHRRKLERRIVNSDIFSQITGSMFSGLIGMLGVAGGLWLLHEGRSLAGLGSVFATLASLLGVYLYQNGRQNNTSSEKPSLPNSVSPDK